MKAYNAREFKKILKINGFVYIRTNGSHSIYKKNEKEIVVNKDLNKMVARRLIKENCLEV